MAALDGRGEALRDVVSRTSGGARPVLSDGVGAGGDTGGADILECRGVNSNGGRAGSSRNRDSAGLGDGSWSASVAGLDGGGITGGNVMSRTSGGARALLSDRVGYRSHTGRAQVFPDGGVDCLLRSRSRSPYWRSWPVARALGAVGLSLRAGQSARRSNRSAARALRLLWMVRTVRDELNGDHGGGLNDRSGRHNNRSRGRAAGWLHIDAVSNAVSIGVGVANGVTNRVSDIMVEVIVIIVVIVDDIGTGSQGHEGQRNGAVDGLHFAGLLGVG